MGKNASRNKKKREKQKEKKAADTAEAASGTWLNAGILSRKMDPKSGIDNRWDFEASGVNLTAADPSLSRVLGWILKQFWGGENKSIRL